MNVATFRATPARAFRHLAAGAALALALIVCDRASAEVADAAPNGFTIVEAAHIAAASDTVYTALIAPQRWWSSAHTFSGSAANMSLDAKAGGCWCESLPGGGSVLHMTVVYAAPGKGLHLRGSLGPFGIRQDGRPRGACPHLVHRTRAFAATSSTQYPWRS